MSVPTNPEAPSSSVPRRRTRRRGLLVLAAIAVVFALVGAACKQLDPNNRAAVVPGVTNGNLPISYLASTSSGCVVYDEAMPSLKAMIAAAAKDGVTLKPLSCYRDYAGQVAARDEWCARGACQMAAVPGTSNHGWGKAIDFRDQSGELTFDSAGYAWMKAWAGWYGWIHPKVMEADGSVPEPWHWEWIGDGGKMFTGQYFGIGNAPLAVPRGLPFGYLDTASGAGGMVTVTGWAIDPDQVASIPVHIYIDSASYGLVADKSRPDVNAVYPLFAKAQHGFSASLPATPGPHNVCAWAINVAGTGYNRLLGCLPVVVTPPAAPAATPVAPTTTSSLAPPSTTTTTTAAAANTVSTATTAAPAQATASTAR
jgi:hypothetical protein